MELKIDPRKKHRISPYLYMQFMEPLGVCDSSVDCGWDFIHDCWKQVLIDKVKELGPGMVRFGGCFASYYHWKEAVGPKQQRIPMINYCWDGIYNNQVGTHEIIDFCDQVGAEPLLVVNMESDGRMHWAHPENGTDRFGTAEEAAEWVSYCNNEENPLRWAHGRKEPYHVHYWQIGNETSYDKNGYSSDKAIEVTKRFAKAMKEADPSIHLIGWGDEGSGDDSWCRKMAQVEEIDTIAFHHHFDSGLEDSPLIGTKYREDPEKTWKHLMHAYRSLETHIEKMRADCGEKRLVMTEGHYALPGRNRNEVLSTWGAGVSYARCLNVIMRNSDIIDIATMADFFGNVWQVNAILMTTQGEKIAYFQPVATVMSLFSHHQGEYAVDVQCEGEANPLDITASAADDRIYLHLINTDRCNAVSCKLSVDGKEIREVKMFGVAEDPMTEVTPVNPDVFAVREMETKGDTIQVPPAAVVAVEIRI